MAFEFLRKAFLRKKSVSHDDIDYKAIEKIRELVGLLEEERILKEGQKILGHELRITTQRVNLFEKVKIPEATENIRLIRIYLGDQQTNAVGRSKIAKGKIEEMVGAWLTA